MNDQKAPILHRNGMSAIRQSDGRPHSRSRRRTGTLKLRRGIGYRIIHRCDIDLRQDDIFPVLFPNSHGTGAIDFATGRQCRAGSESSDRADTADRTGLRGIRVRGRHAVTTGNEKCVSIRTRQSQGTSCPRRTAGVGWTRYQRGIGNGIVQLSRSSRPTVADNIASIAPLEGDRAGTADSGVQRWTGSARHEHRIEQTRSGGGSLTVDQEILSVRTRQSDTAGTERVVARGQSRTGGEGTGDRIIHRSRQAASPDQYQVLPIRTKNGK